MVTVQLNWLHFASFGGIYAADQNGYYAEEGLDVTLIEGGPDVDYISPVVNSTAEFGVAGADALILAHAEGRPVRAFATILRISPITIVSPRESGILHPEDLIGKTIRVTPQIAPGFRAMMDRMGINSDQYQEVILPSSLELFASEDVDAWGVYLNSFAVTLRNEGYELNHIFPHDYGIHFYSDSLFTTDALIETNPELVQRFLRATLRGQRYAIENPDQVGQMVALYDSDVDTFVQADMMRASIPLIHTGRNDLGWMNPEIWDSMAATLREQGVLMRPLDVTDVYTMRFLHQVYEQSD